MKKMLLLFFCLFWTAALSAYVCNSGNLGPIHVTIQEPDPLEKWGQPQEVQSIFENSSAQPITIRFCFRTFAPLRFCDSKDLNQNRQSGTLTVPAHDKLIFRVKIAAEPGAFCGHYPINLDLYLKDQFLNVVQPIETKLPPNDNWKIDDLPLMRTLANWKSPKSWKDPSGAKLVFNLDSGNRATVIPGELGLADALISVESKGRTVKWQGLRIFVAGLPLYSREPGKFVSDGDKKNNRWTQTFRYKDREYRLFYEIRQNKGAIQFKIDCSVPELLTWLEFGPCDRKLDAISLGHGYYVKKPGAFRIESNGHSFASSFIGLDYDNNASVLMASEALIHSFENLPDQNRHSIAVCGPTVLTLVPGTMAQGGSMDCAIRYRAVFDKKPASGVHAKQGRFVVDIWNGLYAQQAQLIRDAAELYGLKNDLIFITHNWQRFRYDHRLPDVWPPNPLFGSREDLLNVMKTAQSNGWYFGTHNNVIDYYPDSSSFSFDNVSFRPDGSMQKAYRNVFLKAQSYRLAPHRAADVLGTCLKQMNDDQFIMNCCFVDVLSAAPVHASRNYFDKNGKTISQLQAYQGVANVFNNLHKIQNAALKKTALKEKESITVSEAGHDYLIGSLDGADCQFINLNRQGGGEYCWFNIPRFTDAEKIPWFDAVNHPFFSLHGVGYSIRYEGGRGRELHGIDSDDYICAELLTGHALMTDGFCRDVKEILSGYIRSLNHIPALRQTVRKYYLAQGIMRELANDEIIHFDFIDGDIHRQKVQWKGGMTVYVNRGTDDWTVDGIVLPQYGYLARNKKTGSESMIHRLDGRVVEQSSWKENGKLIRYVNGRNRELDKLIPVSPKGNVKMTPNDSKIKIEVQWIPYKDKAVPSSKFQITFFLVKRKGAETSLYPDFTLGTVQGDLRKTVSAEFDLPKTEKGRYDILVGVAPQGRDVNHVDSRMKLLATPSFFYRYHLGELALDPVKQAIFTPFEEKDQSLYDRLFPPKKEINFGFCRTKGGFRLEYDAAGKVSKVIQLPGEPGTGLKIISP